jgi:hemin uptake protein HemP
MMNLRDNALRQPHKSSGSSARVAITRKAIPLHDLLGGTNEALIEHNGQVYVLRLTKQGRVLLTK